MPPGHLHGEVVKARPSGLRPEERPWAHQRDFCWPGNALGFKRIKGQFQLKNFRHKVESQTVECYK